MAQTQLQAESSLKIVDFGAQASLLIGTHSANEGVDKISSR